MSLSVLIVDDSPLMRCFVRRIINLAGSTRCTVWKPPMGVRHYGSWK